MGKKKGGGGGESSGTAGSGAAAGGAAAPSVEAMEVRHILMEKHSACLKVSASSRVCMQASTLWRIGQGIWTITEVLVPAEDTGIKMNHGHHRDWKLRTKHH